MDPTAAKALIEQVRDASRAYESKKAELEVELSSLRTLRDEAIMAAVAAGMSERVVARAAGLARSRIYTLRHAA